uniref:FBD domain-containing protein n=1 Tax=Leersia perrieri TaxID=77586 RepID=A0A0D9W5B5_9ORYZ
MPKRSRAGGGGGGAARLSALPDGFILKILSSTLKKLALYSCIHYTRDPVAISVPCLESLDMEIQYMGYEGGISLCDTASLVKASIAIEYIPEKYQCNILGTLFNVTDLELLGFETMDDLFDKLEALGSFLENAPCLEKLTLDYCMFDVGVEQDIERENITLYHYDLKTFECPKLKLVEIGYEDDVDH